EPGHDLQGVLQQVEALAGGGERDAELVVLLVEPGGAERQLQAAMRGVVHGQGLGREHRRVAVGHPGHQQAQPDPRRQPRQRGQRRDALEHLARPLAVHRLEVVEAPGAVEAEVRGELHAGDDLVPRHPLLRDIQPETHPRTLATGRPRQQIGPFGPGWRQRPASPCEARTTAMLTFDGATKRFGGLVALDGCSFVARPGRLTGFLGPNGAGKTTAMRAVFGLVALDAGSVRWRGVPVGPRVRARFGYMPEERGLYPRMRVRDQLVYLGRL